MEDYIVSALKYRPTTWESVVGQSSITTTLQNAIKNNHLAKAFLFCGPRGVGKTTTARILAKEINKNYSDNKNSNFEYNIFELDAASNNSVENIRDLIEKVKVPPQIGKYKVYIIDEVHMLSNAAFNAFLKTLEEPPAHAIFILATTEKHKILPTIVSRCQVFDFNRISIKNIVEYLKYISENEKIEAEEEALHIIAQKSEGGLRDALSLFDQIASFSGNKITYQNVLDNLNILDYEYYFSITNAILKNDHSECIILFNQIYSKGFEGHNFISGLAKHFRDLIICLEESTYNLLEAGKNIAQKYKEQSLKCSREFILNALILTNECEIKYKQSKNQHLLVELTLLQLASLTLTNLNNNKKKNL